MLNDIKITEMTQAKIAQWKTCMEMENAVNERRHNMNNLFITVNLAIATAVSYIWDYNTIYLVLISGILQCIIWIYFLQSYRYLNAAKVEVLRTLEETLPVKAVTEETEILQKNKKYKEISKLELFLPVVFILLYTGCLLFRIIM